MALAVDLDEMLMVVGEDGPVAAAVVVRTPFRATGLLHTRCFDPGVNEDAGAGRNDPPGQGRRVFDLVSPARI
jgi:hypothetical protein